MTWHPGSINKKNQFKYLPIYQMATLYYADPKPLSIYIYIYGQMDDIPLILCNINHILFICILWEWPKNVLFIFAFSFRLTIQINNRIKTIISLRNKNTCNASCILIFPRFVKPCCLPLLILYLKSAFLSFGVSMPLRRSGNRIRVAFLRLIVEIMKFIIWFPFK